MHSLAGGNRFRIAQHLAGHPVLAIAAVIIAAEHAKGERIGAGQDMKERLLLDRIARQRPDISVRHEQRAVVIEAHAANPIAPRLDDAAMPAGEALHRAVLLSLDQRLGRRHCCAGAASASAIEAFFVL